MILRQIREASGLTQAEAANKLGIAVMTLSRYESGEREPRASDLCQMAKLFNCTVDELLGRSGPHEASDVHQASDL